MYSFLRGEVAFIDEGAIALDVNGVGYKVFVTLGTLESAEQKPEMMLYTKLVVKEDDMSIYGFETRQEKSMFERLLSVSGVGPKAGLAILSK